VYAWGDEHAVGAAPSRAQVKPTPASASSNPNDTSGPLGSLGADVMVGTGGGVVSFVTVNVRDTERPTLLSASVARTWKVCWANVRPVYVVLAALPDPHAVHAPESILHSNVDTSWAAYPNVTLLEGTNALEAGPEVIVVAGARSAAASRAASVDWIAACTPSFQRFVSSQGSTVRS
jgi:hypothetical protein